MKKLFPGLLILTSIACASPAGAAGKQGYASARAACLTQAGTTEAIFSARKATYAQGAIYKECMTAKGHNISVYKSDGSKLY